MNDSRKKISLALEAIDSNYLEETLDFEPTGSHSKRTIRFSKLSAVCAALLVLFTVSATAIAIGKVPLSWRDIFRPSQTVIGDKDEMPVISRHNTPVKELKIDVVKAISDERVLYLLYSMKANQGASLAPDGRFASFTMYFPGKMMSGAYQQYFLERKDGVPANELEGVIYADWQADENAQELIVSFSNWQEKKLFEDVKVDFDVAEMVAVTGENKNLPALYVGHDLQYLWQPGNADLSLPYNGISLCGAGWENGILQIVMKGHGDMGEWSTGQNWYFIDTRTGAVIRPEQSAYYHTPDELGENLNGADQLYFWNFVSVDKDALPYLEMHWGGAESFATVFPREWEVHISETPITVHSELLAENVKLSCSDTELLAKKIECSKLSLAVYFEDYVDPTTGILRQFKAFDENGEPIPCYWGFTADPAKDSCVIWARFDAPIEPESVEKITFNNDTIFQKS